MSSVTEYMASRGITTSGGRATSTRTFFAEGYANPGLVFNLMVSRTIPRPGDSHPDFRGLTARDYTIEPVAGHTDLWQVDYTYEQQSNSVLGQPQNPPQRLPNEVDYVEASADIRAEFQPTYRIDGTPALAYPPNGNAPNNTTSVVGEPIDAAGVPLSRQRNIQEITLTETVNSPVRLTFFAGFRFTRNKVAFLEWPAGVLMYRGCSIRRTGVDVYQVAHQFVADDQYHLQQQPRMDGNGEPFLDNGHAMDVYWVQPFPNLKYFGSISRNF